MPKKVIKRKSSPRRISVRPLGVNSRGEPLSFWHFIRKNFLLIAGLLMLPLTVFAVTMSYGTFSGSSSAATLNTQDLNTLDGSTCLVEKLGGDIIYSEGRVDCKGWPRADVCRVCLSGEMEPCNQPSQFAVCDITPPSAGNSCSSPSTPNQQYACVPTLKLCHFCNNGQWRACDDVEKQEKCGISIPICSNLVCEEGEDNNNCPKDCLSSEPTLSEPTQVNRQPTIVQPTDEPSKPTPMEKECDQHGRYVVSGCGENNCPAGSKFKCTYYTTDKRTGDCGGKECSCEPDPACGDVGLPQGQPDQNANVVPKEECPNGGRFCPGGYCKDGSDYGADNCAPQSDCGVRREQACEGKKGGWVRDKNDVQAVGVGGFDVKKVINNFFNLFRF